MNDNIINEAVRIYDTPLYIYDEKVIRKYIRDLKNALPKNSSLYYSIKANPLKGICKIVNSENCGIEIASKGELSIALDCGFLPDNIIFSGPGKTLVELTTAIKNKIKYINIESYSEAKIINDIAKKENMFIKVALRINPSFSVSGSKIKMVGVPSQFGIDEEALNENIQLICALSNIEVIGFQFYLGTQNLNAKDIVNNTKESIKCAINLSKLYSIKLQYLNLGGGFGIAYFRKEKDLDLRILKDGLNYVFKNYNDILKHTYIIFESGRFLLAESGCFVSKIIYKKSCRNKKYLICDGGSNLHSSAAFLGRYVRNNFPIRIITEKEGMEEVTITGPLCTPSDIIGNNIKINVAEEGDLVVIEKSGAYGLTHSPILFLSHELPAEVLYNDGSWNLLRKREALDLLIGGSSVETKSCTNKS